MVDIAAFCGPHQRASRVPESVTSCTPFGGIWRTRLALHTSGRVEIGYAGFVPPTFGRNPPWLIAALPIDDVRTPGSAGEPTYQVRF
jgi:hypothetical protein